MQDRLLNNHGDLYGRVTYEIKLAPKDCGMVGLCLRERLLQLRRPDQGCAWRVRRGIRKLCLVTSAYIANFPLRIRDARHLRLLQGVRRDITGRGEGTVGTTGSHMVSPMCLVASVPLFSFLLFEVKAPMPLCFALFLLLVCVRFWWLQVVAVEPVAIWFLRPFLASAYVLHVGGASDSQSRAALCSNGGAELEVVEVFEYEVVYFVVFRLRPKGDLGYGKLAVLDPLKDAHPKGRIK